MGSCVQPSSRVSSLQITTVQDGVCMCSASSLTGAPSVPFETVLMFVQPFLIFQSRSSTTLSFYPSHTTGLLFSWSSSAGMFKKCGSCTYFLSFLLSVHLQIIFGAGHHFYLQHVVLPLTSSWMFVIGSSFLAAACCSVTDIRLDVCDWVIISSCGMMYCH